MRLKSELLVSALLRRVFNAGGFAAVERRGAEEAGAIFIRQHFRDGSETLYAPAPQSFMTADDVPGRRFEIRLEKAEPDEVRSLLEREARFDGDLWIIELETDDVDGLIEVVKPDQQRG